MSRERGTFNFAANFEPLLKAPLDSRMKVGSYSDLIDPSTWSDANNNSWIFPGAIVVVASDPSSGIYWLKNSDYTNYSNWERSVSGSFDPSALYFYIDGSLALRDASISYLYSQIFSLDSSIQRIDSSLLDLYSRDTSVGVINIGDGSANIFAGYDSSNNITLRTISGSGAAIVYQVGNKIIIGLDASFAGEINYGENVGSGDASIYVQKSGDALQFREIKGGTNISVSVSENLVIINNIGGSAIDGGVWITDINPSGSGNVGDKVTSSDGVVLDSCLTDTSALTVSVLALPGHTNYKPNVYINSLPVTLVANPDKPLFEGNFNLTFNPADTSITVLHEDGASWSTIVDQDSPPVILSAVFTGGYPGLQSELKAGDSYQVNIITDVSIVTIELDNYGAFTANNYSVSGNNVIITGTIADRGTSTQSLGFRLRAVKSTGSTSINYLSADYGSVDGVNLVKLNNTYPTINFSSVSYPASQGAIKTSESATVNHTVSNFSTLTYSSPTGELTISNSTTYEPAKNVNYLSGTYNITTNNFRIVANRSENNANSTGNSIVFIANSPATLSVSNPASRLRSGGNDGTSAQNHTITINSSQRLLSAPTLVKDTGGTWIGGGFSWSASATSFTRSLQVHDNDSKATYNWGAISGTNLAGIVTSTNIGASTYTLGGFVVRTISVDAFGWQSNINVEISDYTKLSSTGSGQNLAWSVKNLPTRSTIGDVTRPQANVWSASATFTNPTTINILDKSATDSASQASTFTIQEGI